ncbi:MAG: LysM peptidoglycan-binding domain-containing protein [Pseudomonadota bacterium]
MAGLRYVAALVALVAGYIGIGSAFVGGQGLTPGLTQVGWLLERAVHAARAVGTGSSPQTEPGGVAPPATRSKAGAVPLRFTHVTLDPRKAHARFQGSAPRSSDVSILINGQRVARARAGADGIWQFDAPLKPQAERSTGKPLALAGDLTLGLLALKRETGQIWTAGGLRVSIPVGYAGGPIVALASEREASKPAKRRSLLAARPAGPKPLVQIAEAQTKPTAKPPVTAKPPMTAKPPPTAKSTDKPPAQPGAAPSLNASKPQAKRPLTIEERAAALAAEASAHYDKVRRALPKTPAEARARSRKPDRRPAKRQSDAPTNAPRPGVKQPRVPIPMVPIKSTAAPQREPPSPAAQLREPAAPSSTPHRDAHVVPTAAWGTSWQTPFNVPLRDDGEAHAPGPRYTPIRFTIGQAFAQELQRSRPRKAVRPDRWPELPAGNVPTPALLLNRERAGDGDAASPRARRPAAADEAPRRGRPQRRGQIVQLDNGDPDDVDQFRFDRTPPAGARRRDFNDVMRRLSVPDRRTRAAEGRPRGFKIPLPSWNFEWRTRVERDYQEVIRRLSRGGDGTRPRERETAFPDGRQRPTSGPSADELAAERRRLELRAREAERRRLAAAQAREERARRARAAEAARQAALEAARQRAAREEEQRQAAALSRQRELELERQRLSAQREQDRLERERLARLEAERQARLERERLARADRDRRTREAEERQAAFERARQREAEAARARQREDERRRQLAQQARDQERERTRQRERNAERERERQRLADRQREQAQERARREERARLAVRRAAEAAARLARETEAALEATRAAERQRRQDRLAITRARQAERRAREEFDRQEARRRLAEEQRRAADNARRRAEAQRRLVLARRAQADAERAARQARRAADQAGRERRRADDQRRSQRRRATADARFQEQIRRSEEAAARALAAARARQNADEGDNGVPPTRRADAPDVDRPGGNGFRPRRRVPADGRPPARRRDFANNPTGERPQRRPGSRLTRRTRPDGRRTARVPGARRSPSRRPASRSRARGPGEAAVEGPRPRLRRGQRARRLGLVQVAACEDRAGRRITMPGWYITQPGDSLWAIAARHYQTGQGFGLIQRANRRAVPRANRIYVCQRLRLPMPAPRG